MTLEYSALFCNIERLAPYDDKFGILNPFIVLPPVYAVQAVCGSIGDAHRVNEATCASNGFLPPKITGTVSFGGIAGIRIVCVDVELVLSLVLYKRVDFTKLTSK